MFETDGQIFATGKDEDTDAGEDEEGTQRQDRLRINKEEQVAAMDARQEERRKLQEMVGYGYIL